MIAYHFPPLSGSSGIQRTLSFARYLTEFGWQPIVLTVHPRAYRCIAGDQLDDIPRGVEVIRAPAWDSSRHFAVGGRYPGFLARPDRWVSWWPGAIVKGLGAIRRFKPEAIWSTYPIATAHRIGLSLSKFSGLPWVADFRDPMAQPDYPTDPAIWKRYELIERKTVAQARFSSFTTPAAAQTYRVRYPESADRIRLLENGYDEEAFSNEQPHRPLQKGKITLLHSGIVYPNERDPKQLFAALAKLKSFMPDYFANMRVRFRAAVHEAMLIDLAERYQVAEAIEILPPIGYRDALHEMQNADGLLILQAANCNAQVPAKLYEYFRAGRPILALTDPAGDTAITARAAGIEAIAPLDDADSILQLITQFIERSAEGFLPTPVAVARASRKERTRQLAGMLDAAVGKG